MKPEQISVTCGHLGLTCGLEQGAQLDILISSRLMAKHLKPSYSTLLDGDRNIGSLVSRTGLPQVCISRNSYRRMLNIG